MDLIASAEWLRQDPTDAPERLAAARELDAIIQADERGIRAGTPSSSSLLPGACERACTCAAGLCFVHARSRRRAQVC